MNEKKLGTRLEQRISDLRYFDEELKLSASNIVADKHLLWAALTENQQFPLSFFSPLDKEYIAFFDVYLEFFFKNLDESFPKPKEVENFLRDQNHIMAYSDDFNWQLAEKLMNSLGLALRAHFDNDGGLICHCYDYKLSFLMRAIKELKTETAVSYTHLTLPTKRIV